MKTLVKTVGKRIPDPGDSLGQPGDYWKDRNGDWRGVTPNGLYAWLKNHHVDEHENGTISVVSGQWGTNSILASGGVDGLSWHGAIDKGVWKEF